MQKNGKVFSLLLSRSSKSRIYIRRVEVSKLLLQNGLLSFVLIFGAVTFGLAITRVFDAGISSVDFAASYINPAVNPLPATVYAKKAPPIAQKSDLPAGFAPNVGGPAEPSDSELDTSAVEKQLVSFRATSDPAFVPSIWAHIGKINNEFGFRRNPFGGKTYEFHAGMDIGGDRGDPVAAPASGTVTKASYQGGYGNMIEVDHGNGLISRYAHLSKIDTEVGASVTRGDVIGYVGSTGRSTGPHLHYELRFNDKPVNPRGFLPPEPAALPEAP